MTAIEWEPKQHHADPAVNALLNIAESIAIAAGAIDDLLCGLKYSKDNGLSVAEAIEVGAKRIAEAIESAD